jgi:hypothetical protein
MAAHSTDDQILGAFYLQLNTKDDLIDGPKFDHLVKIHRRTNHITCGIYLQNDKLIIVEKSRCMLKSDTGELFDYQSFGSAWGYLLYRLDPGVCFLDLKFTK